MHQVRPLHKTLIQKIAGSNATYLATYGTLRRRSQYSLGVSIVSRLKFYGHGMLRGLLLTQYGYPGVVEHPGLVRVEIFRVLSESVWPELDHYEGYDPGIGERSIFVRKAVALVQPRIYAWAYFLGKQIPRGHLIEML